MVCGIKHVIRAGVIGGLALGAVVAVAGTERVGALFRQTRENINRKIDRNITDPVALRAQLRDLEAQYPRRIESVKGDLAELREQRAAMERELAVANRAISLADADRETLLAQLDQAESRRIETVSMGTAEPRIVIVFRNERLDAAGAQTRCDQIAAKRSAFAAKAVEIQRNLDLLARQETRLAGILSKLESERTAFQAQLWSIDQEVDAIARNDRMIEIVGKWQKSIDEQGRYRAGSLDQVRARLADVRARQEARLDAFAQTSDQDSYEQRAKIDLDRESAAARATEPARSRPSPRPAEQVIEILPLKNLPPAAATPAPAASVASSAGAR
jgi:hypothetical protein